MSAIATVGVYGFSGPSFIEALEGAAVTEILDVRQRRGVRGPEYAWANAQRLQAALAAAGIGYRHLKQLAPTTELRQLQYAEDARTGVGKRSRTELGAEYRDGYTREILDRADLDQVARSLPAEGLAALLCVERDPDACHRSIVAGRLAAEHGLDVVHIKPGQRSSGR
ncbi:MAG TPA: DUF488 domain-containing protein [Solirubrobacterales bacterium]|nr:DUF488 domain-containing protein [Solirubrobacterales bacterium]